MTTPPNISPQEIHYAMEAAYKLQQLARPSIGTLLPVPYYPTEPTPELNHFVFKHLPGWEIALVSSHHHHPILVLRNVATSQAMIVIRSTRSFSLRNLLSSEFWHNWLRNISNELVDRSTTRSRQMGAELQEMFGQEAVWPAYSGVLPDVLAMGPKGLVIGYNTHTPKGELPPNVQLCRSDEDFLTGKLLPHRHRDEMPTLFKGPHGISSMSSTVTAETTLSDLFPDRFPKAKGPFEGPIRTITPDQLPQPKDESVRALSERVSKRILQEKYERYREDVFKRAYEKYDANDPKQLRKIPDEIRKEWQLAKTNPLYPDQRKLGKPTNSLIRAQFKGEAARELKFDAEFIRELELIQERDRVQLELNQGLTVVVEPVADPATSCEEMPELPQETPPTEVVPELLEGVGGAFVDSAIWGGATSLLFRLATNPFKRKSHQQSLGEMAWESGKEGVRQGVVAASFRFLGNGLCRLGYLSAETANYFGPMCSSLVSSLSTFWQLGTDVVEVTRVPLREPVLLPLSPEVQAALQPISPIRTEKLGGITGEVFKRAQTTSLIERNGKEPPSGSYKDVIYEILDEEYGGWT
ncbi:MAG: hypothetical protein AB7F31_03930 [Parachlamydiales bacterium]